MSHNYSICILFYLEVGDVSLEQVQPPQAPSRPRHDVAGQGLMDLFKTEPSSEAGLGGADVAAHSGPMEKEPAT